MLIYIIAINSTQQRRRASALPRLSRPDDEMRLP
jgi:hypothetical protein